MLIKCRAFGGKLESDVYEVPDRVCYRFRLPYYEMNVMSWSTDPPDAIPVRYLEFEYRGVNEEIGGKLVRIMELITLGGVA